jgi:hypothetical protein
VKILGVVRKVVGGLGALARRKPLSADAADEAEYVRFINARGDALRSQRAATWAALVDGRGGWLPRRPDWFSPRRRS